MRKICGMVAGVLMLLAPIGCGSSTGLDLASVRGTVKFQGQPVRNGMIVFEPDVTKNSRGPSGMGPIGKEGDFIISTSSGGDGAIVGFHRVSITGLEPEPIAAGAEPPPSAEKDAISYLKGRAKAAQQATKKPSTKGDTFTDRGGRTFRYVTPKKLSDPAASGIAVEVRSGSNRFDFDIKEDGSAEINR